MKLDSFRVTNYRSVLDSGEINSDDLLVLVGNNQAGKSSILQALEYLSFISSRDIKKEITRKNNIKGKVADKRLDSKNVSIISGIFSFTKDEVNKFSDIISKIWDSDFSPKTELEEFFYQLLEKCKKEEVVIKILCCE